MRTAPRSRSGYGAVTRLKPAAGCPAPAAGPLPGRLSIGGRDGSLLLHAPAGPDPAALTDWAWSKPAWVFRKLAEKDLLLSPSPGKDFVTGEGFDYLGRHYRLQLTDDQPGRGVSLRHGRLHIPRGRRSLGRNDPLNIHWAAMQLPVSLVDYVIVHELAHISEPRHTPHSGPPSSAPCPTATSAAPGSPPPAPPSGSADLFGERRSCGLARMVERVLSGCRSRTRSKGLSRCQGGR